MISNGRDKGLPSGSLPDVGGFLLDWMQPLTFIMVRKIVEEGVVTEIPTTIETKGVRQPMSAQAISRKPEGMRDWKWQTLHVLPEVILKNDDRVVFNGEPYRVQMKTDWKEYGYLQYDICEDYR